MATTDWYVDNSARAYPFIASPFEAPEPDSLAALLPQNAVVDAQVIFGTATAYDAATHFIWLESVSRDGDVLTFTWRITAPAASIWYLQDETHYVEHVVTVDGQYSTVLAEYEGFPAGELECGQDTAWEMQVVFGRLQPDELDNWILDGETLTAADDSLRLEPGCIQSMGSAHARSIVLANTGRTRATQDDGTDLDWPTEAAAYYLQEPCLNGVVRFENGFNAVVELDASSNSLTVSARVGAGKGESCEDSPLFPEDEAPVDRTTLDGGLRCGEVLRSINGVGGRAIELQVGAGIRLDVRPASNTLVLTIGGTSDAGCFPVDDAVLDSEICSQAIAADCVEFSAGNAASWRCSDGVWVFTRDHCLLGQRPVNPALYGIICGSEEFPEGSCLEADCEEVT